ncbi:MAG TPA: hypothetical protein VJU86_11895 [Pyrinomonadaceae bacterium]|nr:hypothetical protein [Pyrinomonadaceae bacterium]
MNLRLTPVTFFHTLELWSAYENMPLPLLNKIFLIQVGFPARSFRGNPVADTARRVCSQQVRLSDQSATDISVKYLDISLQSLVK